ncbi:MAG: hypothetical protein ACRCZO_03950 [Cetobacterium sp.]|uniref:hypothetical protein n=1 Tax=Cetobacterium sp. TaxID=2071632 RepID=UPI0025E5AA3B|nr:hypothetical protein [uncultured Cetobacterium sp.]
MEKKENSIYFKPIVTFRISKKTLEKLEEKAKIENKTRTQLLIQIINRHLDL